MASNKNMSEAELHRGVIDELRWDSRVDESDVGVAVDSGVVTLTGTVSSYAKKLAAQEAAHQVTGVLDVANDIVVKVPTGLTRTDTEIAQAVRHTLEWDVLVPHEGIRTTVANGWVTLEGTVTTWTDRRNAEEAVRFLAGVRGVTDKLVVTAAQVTAERVKHTIEGALARRMEREAERIRVGVFDGTVTLTGNVRTWNEKKAILGAVGHAAGVRAVEDHLRICSGI